MRLGLQFTFLYFTLGVMRWQPRRSAGRVTVFCAHLGLEAMGLGLGLVLELEFFRVPEPGFFVNRAFTRTGGDDGGFTCTAENKAEAEELLRNCNCIFWHFSLSFLLRLKLTHYNKAQPNSTPPPIVLCTQ